MVNSILFFARMTFSFSLSFMHTLKQISDVHSLTRGHSLVTLKCVHPHKHTHIHAHTHSSVCRRKSDTVTFLSNLWRNTLKVESELFRTKGQSSKGQTRMAHNFHYQLRTGFEPTDDRKVSGEEQKWTLSCSLLIFKLMN